MDFDKVQGKYGDQPVEMASFGGDAGCVAEFYLGRIYHEGDTLERAKAAGEPVYVEEDFVRITFPGNTKTVYDQPVIHKGGPLRPSDPERFPRQWAAYKAGRARTGGTSLLEVDGVTPGDVRKFEGMSIYTAENLADVSDGNLGNLGLGGREARESARRLILSRQAAQTGSNTDEIAALREQIAALTAQQERPRRGRPPNDQQEAA